MSNFIKNLHPILRRIQGGQPNNVNDAVLKAIDDTLKEAELETINARAHSSLDKATGDFLDVWGVWHGVLRKPLETDQKYRERILGAVDVPRGSMRAIKEGIQNYLGETDFETITEETWQNIFWLNRSKLNSSAHLMGEVYRYGVVLIYINQSYPAKLLELISLYKPAGVTVLVNYDAKATTVDVYTGKAMEGLIEPGVFYVI